MARNDNSIHRGSGAETGDNEAQPTETGTGPAQATFDPTSLGAESSLTQPREGPYFDAADELGDNFGFEVMEPTDGRLGLTNTEKVPPDDWAADTGETKTP